MVGCTNSTVQCFSLKGKRSFCISLASPILAVHGLETAQQKIAKCLVVSLANGTAFLILVWSVLLAFQNRVLYSGYSGLYASDSLATHRR